MDRTHDTNDGACCSRRSLLKAGVLGLLALGMPGRFLLEEAYGLTPDPNEKKYDAVIQIFFQGGPSQTDTLDPKPGSPNNIFDTINLGAKDIYGKPIRVSQLFPRLADLITANTHYDLALLRSVVHGNGAHDFAQTFMNCFWQSPVAENYPSTAAVMQYYHRDMKGGIGTPAVVIDGNHGDQVNDAKGSGLETSFQAPEGSFTVDSLEAPAGVDAARMARRQEILDTIDDSYLANHPDQLAKAWPAAVKRARAVTTSGLAAKAFDLTGKPILPIFGGGDAPFARRLTLAQELVKAGVPYVSVAIGGNDTHTNNRGRVSQIWGRTIDPAVSKLATNLQATGKRVLIALGGEFGRTPDTVASGRDGRDHHPDGFSWALFSINQPKYKTTAIGDTGPHGMWTRSDGTLKDWIAPSAIGGLLYRSLGYPVGSDPRYDIPTKLGKRSPVDKVYVLGETDPYPFMTTGRIMKRVGLI